MNGYYFCVLIQSTVNIATGKYSPFTFNAHAITLPDVSRRNKIKKRKEKRFAPGCKFLLCFRHSWWRWSSSATPLMPKARQSQASSRQRLCPAYRTFRCAIRSTTPSARPLTPCPSSSALPASPSLSWTELERWVCLFCVFVPTCCVLMVVGCVWTRQ